MAFHTLSLKGRALRYLSMREHSRLELVQKLKSFEETPGEIDRLLDELVICGTVDQVVEGILKLREEAGDFGELVYAGMDWVDPILARRSMVLMAEEVMPRVNQAIGAR